MNAQRLVLASSSRWRKEEFEKTGATFETCSPDIDEKNPALRDRNPRTMTVNIAMAKAIAVVNRFTGPDGIIIACDQVVVKDGVVREKPTSVEEARAFLMSYSESDVEVVNGVAVLHTASRAALTGHDTARVRFKRIPPDVVETVLATSSAMHSCGALVVENPALTPYVEGIDGDRDSVQGMPLRLTRNLLAHFGYRLP